MRRGRYAVRLSTSTSYEVEVPDQWRVFQGRFLSTPPSGANSIFFAAPAPADASGLPRHPCQDHTMVPVGPTVGDLAAGLRGQPVLEVSQPTPATLDGHRGVYVEVRIPETVDSSSCVDDTVALLEAVRRQRKPPGCSIHELRRAPAEALPKKRQVGPLRRVRQRMGTVGSTQGVHSGDGAEGLSERPPGGSAEAFGRVDSARGLMTLTIGLPREVVVQWCRRADVDLVLRDDQAVLPPLTPRTPQIGLGHMLGLTNRPQQLSSTGSGFSHVRGSIAKRVGLLVTSAASRRRFLHPVLLLFAGWTPCPIGHPP